MIPRGGGGAIREEYRSGFEPSGLILRVGRALAFGGSVSSRWNIAVIESGWAAGWTEPTGDAEVSVITNGGQG